MPFCQSSPSTIVRSQLKTPPPRRPHALPTQNILHATPRKALVCEVHAHDAWRIFDKRHTGLHHHCKPSLAVVEPCLSSATTRLKPPLVSIEFTTFVTSLVHTTHSPAWGGVRVYVLILFKIARPKYDTEIRFASRIQPNTSNGMPPKWPAMNKTQCKFIRICNKRKFKNINVKKFKLFDGKKS